MNTAANSSTATPPPEQKSPQQTVSVVICTCNRPDDLRKCIEAISQSKPAPYEVIVVDNTAGDNATKCIARESGARYVVEPTPGLSRARNRGLAESHSEIVAYVDDDAIPTSRWLEPLVEPFADPSVAAVTGETVPSVSDTTLRNLRPRRRLCNQDQYWFEIAAFGGLGIGANMALRKSACIGWKVFNERLGRGAPFRIGEESHAFASLIARGYSVVHAPAATVVHPFKQIKVAQEAMSSVAYWLLLFSEFPSNRLDLIQFLVKRLRRKRLPWPRVPQEAGEIINSAWRVHLHAALAGILLFLRNPKPRD